MKINDRLKHIGDLVEANSFCLDIGCDHAFLDIYLVKQNKNIKAIATDIAEGPVKQARENIKREGLEDTIEVRLGNGLDTYSDEVNTVIIAGMGGRNMIGIFKNNMKVLKKIDTIIVSPNNYQIDVKKFLTKNGFYIDDEELVKEKKFIYQIILEKNFSLDLYFLRKRVIYLRSIIKEKSYLERFLFLYYLRIIGIRNLLLKEKLR